MSVHLTRQRKKGGPWYARGTVRLGKTKVSVAEFSTGQSARTAALDAAAAEESRIRAEIIDGPAVRAAELTIADAILAYASRAGGIHALDALRLANFNDLIGHWPLNSADGAWSAWIERRASGLAPATVARSRAILRAALAYGVAITVSRRR